MPIQFPGGSHFNKLFTSVRTTFRKLRSSYADVEEPGLSKDIKKVFQERLSRINALNQIIEEKMNEVERSGEMINELEGVEKDTTQHTGVIIREHITYIDGQAKKASQQAEILRTMVQKDTEELERLKRLEKLPKRPEIRPESVPEKSVPESVPDRSVKLSLKELRNTLKKSRVKKLDTPEKQQKHFQKTTHLLHSLRTLYPEMTDQQQSEMEKVLLKAGKSIDFLCQKYGDSEESEGCRDQVKAFANTINEIVDKEYLLTGGAKAHVEGFRNKVVECSKCLGELGVEAITYSDIGKAAGLMRSAVGHIDELMQIMIKVDATPAEKQGLLADIQAAEKDVADLKEVITACMQVLNDRRERAEKAISRCTDELPSYFKPDKESHKDHRLGAVGGLVAAENRVQQLQKDAETLESSFEIYEKASQQLNAVLAGEVDLDLASITPSKMPEEKSEVPQALRQLGMGGDHVRDLFDLTKNLRKKKITTEVYLIGLYKGLGHLRNDVKNVQQLREKGKIFDGELKENTIDPSGSKAVIKLLKLIMLNLRELEEGVTSTVSKELRGSILGIADAIEAFSES